MYIVNSGYRAPWYASASKIQTIWPATYRPTPELPWQRERIELPDGDFLDLDWVHAQPESRRLLVALHGLEGHGRRPYIAHTFKLFGRYGWHGMAVNYRGCSGEPNRLLRGYHSGESNDIRLAIEHAIASGRYDEIGIVGFSAGGNIILKLAGEWGTAAPTQVKKVAAVSAPTNLERCSMLLTQGFNRVYMNSFLKTLRAKAAEKAIRFPGTFDAAAAVSARTFEAYDDAYTAPVHGYKDARDYWRQNSSDKLLPQIAVPTLILNALDDPFLDETAFPVALAREGRFIHLETPRKGGHLGFISRDPEGFYWTERRLLEWFGEA